MNQQPSQQQNNNNGQPQQRIVLQPLQIHSLTESYRSEIAKANELGNQSEEGQEHLKRARRIRLILLRFQEQQRLQRQQQQQLLNGGSLPNTANSNLVSLQGSPLTQTQQQTPALVSRQLSLQNVPQQQQLSLQQQPIATPNSLGTPALQQQSQARQDSQGSTQGQQQQQQMNQQQLQMQRQLNQRQLQQQQQLLQLQRLLQQQLQRQQQQLLQPAAQQQAQGQVPQQQLLLLLQQPNANILQLQKIRKILDDFHGKLRAIENTKRSGSLGPEELARLVQQEELLKQRYDQYTRAAVQMSQQIQLRRAQLAASGNNAQLGLQLQSLPLANTTSANQALVRAQQLQQNQSQSLPQQTRAPVSRTNSQANLTAQAQQQQQQILLLRLQQQQLQQQQAAAAAVASVRSTLLSPAAQVPNLQAQLPQHAKDQASHVNSAAASNRASTQAASSQQVQRTAASGGRSASPGHNSTPVTSVNALARPSAPSHVGSGLGNSTAASVVKSPVPTIPISSTINVPPPGPTTMKGSRPSITGGGAFNSLALTQPATYKLPAFEMEGDRVLHKRKLKELVRSVGSDEGDGETVIDGDVEELLLDLADEFVTNVTSFACRLAKHRKVDNIDVKDIQLHLERNWNIRIPGYSSDEIRSTRRFQPTVAYNQKLSGVDIARSVKKDGN